MRLKRTRLKTINVEINDWLNQRRKWLIKSGHWCSEIFSFFC